MRSPDHSACAIRRKKEEKREEKKTPGRIWTRRYRGTRLSLVEIRFNFYKLILLCFISLSSLLFLPFFSFFFLSVRFYLVVVVHLCGVRINRPCTATNGLRSRLRLLVFFFSSSLLFVSLLGELNSVRIYSQSLTVQAVFVFPCIFQIQIESEKKYTENNDVNDVDGERRGKRTENISLGKIIEVSN